MVRLGALTLIFFFQNVLVRRPVVYVWVRRAYLLFILVWLGWYANAQLSVVNLLALFGVIGGLGAMTSAKTAPEASQSLVAYDAR